jgi:type I restriction enzyme S subunit
MPNDAKPTLTPKLRFPEFREAEEWTPSTLNDIATFHKGRGVSKAEVVAKGDRPCIRYGELYTKYGEVIDEVISRTNSPISDLFLSRANDVIIPASGETKLDIAKASCVMSDGVALGSDLNVLRTSHNGIFLSYLINGAKRFEIARVAQGDTVVHLYPSQLEQISVSVPSPAEQQKIADCLTSLVQLIVAQGRKVEALKAYRKGLLQRIFPREPETLPRLRFPEFRQTAWAQRSIGDLLQESSRPIDMDNDANYSLVTVKRRYGGVVPREVLKGKSIKVKSQFLVKTNDFLISKRQIVHDACGLVPPDLNGSIVSNEYAVLTPRKGCNITFFNYFAQQPCVSKSFLDSSVGIVIEKMLFKLDSWLRFEFLFPTVEEQRRIADCLSALDARIVAETNKLAALKTHKQGLMQQLFPSPEESL